MNKKYILTEETLNWYGRTLHRIKALRSFNDVKEGDLGGWIESEENLSHDGICWVYGEAKVYDEAMVYGDARVYGDAEIFANAWVFGNAEVSSNAKIYGNARVSSNAKIYDNAKVCDRARVFGNAEVYGNAKIYDIAKVCDNSEVCGKTWIFGNSVICGQAKISQTATISKTSDYINIGPIGFRNDFATFFNGENGNILVECGDFSGPIEEFEKLVKEAYENNFVYVFQYTTAITTAKSMLVHLE